MVLDNGVFGASPGLRIRFLLMMWVSREDCSEPRYAVLGIGLTRDRICSALPARTWPSAMLIITTMASPARAFILARPLMKCLSKPKLWSMRLLIRSSAVRRL